MRLELFDVRRRWPRQRTQRDDERGFVNSAILFFIAFGSIHWLYITFKLPRGNMDTPLRLRNFFRYLAIRMCHFRYLWNGLCDRYRAEIIVMQFIGHSLPVHHFFLRHNENFYLVSYCEPSCILQTYGMLQTAFGASSMNQTSVFEKHKRFEEGRKSMRDDERCGRSKEVNAPELIGLKG